VTRLRSDEGVTTVEFALVLPIFIFLVGIATYFGWMFYVQAQVDRAADRAARYAAVPYTTTVSVQQNIDQNKNVSLPGATLSAGLTIVDAYTTTQTSTTYHFCEQEIVDKVNRDLVSGSVAMPVTPPSPTPAPDPTTYDVQVSDGNGLITAASPCAKPNGYVRVQIKKDFTNPFSYIIAPFTGSTSELTVTGTGRARVEAQ
jgi:Flp pilus assembly protein TadG